MEPELFDVVVIGSGNINCLPSKNEIVSAKVADVVRHASAFGTEVAGARLDMGRVLARKRAMVEAEVAFHRQKYRDNQLFSLVSPVPARDAR